MRNLLTTTFFTLIFIGAAHATRTSISSSCILGNCKVVACVDSSCLTFKGASDGQFLRDGKVLRLKYPKRSQLVHFYSWYRNTWLVGEELARNCRECTLETGAPRVIGRRASPGVRVHLDRHGVQITTGSRGGRVVRGGRPAPAPRLSRSLINKIDNACGDTFSFDNESKCREMILTHPNPENAIQKLRILDGELIGQSSTMEVFSLVIDRPISNANLKTCLSEMSFDSGKKSCIEMADRISHRELVLCAQTGSFDSDKLECMRRASY